VLSLQHGVAAGLAAAVVAAGVQFWAGLPPALLTEDMYGYIGRIAAEPIGWTCVALLIGHIRSQQIAQTRELEAELDERTRHSQAVADLCEELRERTELLERQIAASEQASNVDVAEAVSGLNHAGFDDFAKHLTRFVLVMTGAAEFTVYVLKGDALEAVFQPGDEHRSADELTLTSDDPLFAAIVTERRLVSAARPADVALLGQRGIAMAGSLTDARGSGRAIGMLAIGGALDDYPDDIERRFRLAVAELSGSLARIDLVNRWHAAGPADEGRGARSRDHGLDGEDEAASQSKGRAAQSAGRSTSTRAAKVR
jgi:hypothetical protein